MRGSIVSGAVDGMSFATQKTTFPILAQPLSHSHAKSMTVDRRYITLDHDGY
jgi:hypothetical protein